MHSLDLPDQSWQLGVSLLTCKDMPAAFSAQLVHPTRVFDACKLQLSPCTWAESPASPANRQIGNTLLMHRCAWKLNWAPLYLRASSYIIKHSGGNASDTESRLKQRACYRFREGKKASKLPRSKMSYLRDVHHSITAEGSGRGQVIKSQESRDDTILVDSANHGPIHKEDYAVLIHSNACG